MAQFAPFIAWMAVGLGSLLVGIAGVTRGMRRQRRTETIYCPVHHVPMRVRALETVATRWSPKVAVDLDACQHFGADRVTCSKSCLLGPTIFETRQREARAAARLPVI